MVESRDIVVNKEKKNKKTKKQNKIGKTETRLTKPKGESVKYVIRIPIFDGFLSNYKKKCYLYVYRVKYIVEKSRLLQSVSAAPIHFFTCCVMIGFYSDR